MKDFHKKESPFQGITGFAGGATGLRMSSAATKNYIEELFNTYSYKGNDSTTTVTNNIDNSTEGGMVWLKSRSQSYDNYIFDTLRGVSNPLSSNNDAAQQSSITGVSAFNTTGYTIGGSGYTNGNNITYGGWNFRKCSKFFDMVTYTGTGSNRTVSHNLKSIPGCIIVKRTDSTGQWRVYHRGINGGTNPEQYCLKLDSTSGAEAPGFVTQTFWNNTAPTSSVFTVGTHAEVNADGGTYVAYLFAHDEEVFGPDSDKKIISCGNYTGNGSTAGPVVNAGLEPQWLLIKRSSGTEEWLLLDTMRGLPVDGDDEDLRPATANAGNTDRNWLNVTSTGFQPQQSSNHINGSGENYVYIAIAAESGALMNPDSITAGTQVFAPKVGGGGGCPPGTYSTTFRSDYMFWKNVTSTDIGYTASRKSGPKYVRTDHSADATTSSDYVWDSNIGMGSGLIYNSWHWRRHSGFELMSYNGNTTATAYAHNLGGVPEFMIFKNMDVGHDWMCWHKDLNGGVDAENYFWMGNTTGAASTSTDFLNNTAPTATHVTLGAGSQANGTDQIIGMLFRSVSGISYVGSYIGNDSASGPSLSLIHI